MSLALLAMNSAQSATFCVNKDDTTGACSTTIGAAVTLAASDALDPEEVHTITIKAATYEESVTVPNDADLTGLIIKGSGKSIIDPAVTGNPGLTIDAPQVTVSGLVINNTNNHAIDVNSTATGLLISKITINNAEDDCLNIDTVDNVIITGLKFFSCGGDGIDVIGNGAQISKNNFTHVGGSAVHVEGDGHLIESNACARVNRCVEAEAGSDDVIVRRNKTVEHTGTAYEVTGNNAIIEANSGVNGGGLIEVVGTNPRVLANKSKADGGGIRVTCATCATALVERNNLVSTRGSGGGMGGGNACIDLDFDTAGGMLLTNSVRECSRSAFRVRGTGGVTAEKNKSMASGYGQEAAFRIQDAGVKTLLGNSVTFSGGDGFNVEGTGVSIAHVLETNKSSKNGGDGFNLDLDTNGVLLTGNTSTGNIQEGFDNRGTSNVFNENKASKNREGSDFCDGGTTTVGVTLPDDDGTNTFASMTNSCVYP